MQPVITEQSRIDEHNSFVINKRSAEMRYKHARGCRKHLDECEPCKGTIKWFETVPAHQLSEILTETRPAIATFQFATLVVESTFSRGTQLSKRAEADKVEGMRLLSWYQDNGGKLRS